MVYSLIALFLSGIPKLIISATIITVKSMLSPHSKEEEKKKLLSSTRGQLSPSQESEFLGEVLGGAI